MALLEDIAPGRDLGRDPVPAGQEEQGENRRGFGRYLATMGFCLLALYCLPFYLVRRADFEQWSNSPYTAPLNYGFQLTGEDADVVLFGDSTVLHGVDPSRMSRELGVKVVNLPNTAATLQVTDDLLLRRYLQANRQPRLIVFYFAPWDMDYRQTELPIGTYEGRELLAHRGTAGEIFAYARNHLTEALAFPFQFYLANSSWRAIFLRTYRYTGAEAARTHGYFRNPSPKPLSPGCEFWPSTVDNIRVDSVKALGLRYGTPETKILYFVAPVPGCRNASRVVDRSWNELPAAPPRELPLEMFGGATMYLHPAPEAVPAITDALVEAVRPVLAETRPD
jgi:hypothetical protein